MEALPPELEGFAAFLDAQPQPVREIFQYCLCRMMVEAGKMQLVDTVPGEASVICVFESSAGETFSVTQPPMSREEEAEVIKDSCAVLGNRLPSLLVDFNGVRRDVELHGDKYQQLVDHFQWLLYWEPISQPDKDQLIGKAQAVIVAPSFLDFQYILWTQPGFTDNQIV